MNKKLQKGLTTAMAAAMGAGMVVPTIAVMAATTTTGWVKTGATWNYLVNGKMVVNTWAQDSAKKWYFLGADGAMVTNKWAQDSAKKWYFLGADGAMVTNVWAGNYYLTSTGEMAVSAVTLDGYTVDANGLWDGQSKVADVTAATAAVVKAEVSKVQADILAATTLVNALYAGTVKTALTTRIAAINTVVTVSSVTTITANSIKVVFASAVDTTKASFVVMNSYLPVSVTAKFADDAKSVVLTSTDNFAAGTYTVTVKGLTTTDLTSTLKIEAQKLASFTIATSQLLGRIGTQNFVYVAKDQYGNTFDYASTNFQATAYDVTTPSNAVTMGNGTNKFAVTMSAPSVKDNVVVTLVDKTSTISQTVTLSVVADSQVDSVALGTPVPKAKNDLIFVNEAAVDNMYIPITLKDQYGNAMPLSAALLASDVTIFSSNQAIVNPGTTAVPLVTPIDTNGDGVVDSLNFATGATSGSVTLTFISNKTGKTANVTFNVSALAALKSASVIQPVGLVVSGEATTVNYTAMDTLGKTTTFAAGTGNLSSDVVWFSSNPAAVALTDIVVDAKGVLTVKPTGTGTTVLSAFIGGVKQGEISFDVKAAAVETKVASVLPTAITNFAKTAGTYTYKVADFQIIDQYNRVMTAPSGTIALTVKDGTTDTIAVSTNTTITAASTTLGTKTVTVTYTKGAVSLTKDFAVNVIDDSAVVGYTVEPIKNTVLFAGGFANVGAASTNAATFVIDNGLDANNNKIGLSAAETTGLAAMTLTNSNPAAVTVDGATNKAYATGIVDKGAATVAAWKNGKKISEVNFTTSVVPAVLTTLAFSKTSYTVAMPATLDLNADLTGANGTILDQYGVVIALPAGAWFSQDKTIATVNNLGVVTGVKAGTTTIVYVAVNGVTVTAQIVIQ